MKSVKTFRYIAIAIFVVTAFSLTMLVGTMLRTESPLAVFNVITAAFLCGMMVWPLARAIAYRLTPEQAISLLRRRVFPERKEFNWKELLYQELQHKEFDVGHILAVATNSFYRQFVADRNDHFAAMMSANLFRILEGARQLEYTTDPCQRADLIRQVRADIEFIFPLIFEYIRGHGIVVRTEWIPNQPPAMGNYYHNVDTSLTREHWPKP